AGRRGASRLEALTEPGSEMLPARAPSRPRPLGRMWETGPGSGLEGEEGLGHRLEGGGPGLRRPTRAHDELGEAGVDELLQPPPGLLEAPGDERGRVDARPAPGDGGQENLGDVAAAVGQAGPEVLGVDAPSSPFGFGFDDPPP